jgi:hypothetical protein
MHDTVADTVAYFSLLVGTRSLSWAFFEQFVCLIDHPNGVIMLVGTPMGSLLL